MSSQFVQTPDRHVASRSYERNGYVRWGSWGSGNEAGNKPFLDAKVDLTAKYYYDAELQADLSGVGQTATMPRFRENFNLGMGINAPMLDVATPCTYTPAVIVVTSVPAMYMLNGAQPTVMAQLTKDLMETHAKNVTGLDFGYTLGVDTGSNAGMDGQMFGVPTKTTRSQPSPSFVFTELSGNLVYNWAKKWIWDIQHPDTNASMTQVQFPGAYTMSAYAASFMVIQFDPTMRPDRIIVGECRGNETLDMLQAMNTGHDGSLTTVHANSPRDVISRLETMVLMSGVELPSRAIREQVASAVQIIVQEARLSDGSRKITAISEITGMEGQQIVMQDLFVFHQTGVDAQGHIQGSLMPTGAMPTFFESFAQHGIPFNPQLFSPDTAQ
jgi:hypothetical protein